MKFYLIHSRPVVIKLSLVVYYIYIYFFLKCDLILQAKCREYNKSSVKQNSAANQIEQKELKKEG